MVKLKDVHFTLNPKNTRDNKVIKILEQLPERQTKNFFISLIESRSDMAQIAQEVHALAVHFGVSVKIQRAEPAPAQQTRQLDGQIGVDDLKTIMEENNNISEVEPSAQEDADVDFREADRQEDDELPEGVMDFISGMSDWGGQ